MVTAKDYFESVRESRVLWRSRFTRCMYCGVASDILEVHEIARRSSAPRSWGHTCNYLLLCGSLSKNKCHEKKFAAMPHVRQLAIKKIKDPRHYSLVDWLKIQDPELNAPNRITQQEVDDEIRELLIFFNEQQGMKF